LWSSGVSAEDDIFNIDTKNDNLMHIASVFMFTDYLTTLDIRRHNGFYEKNSWAGSGEFKRSRINTYFLLKGLTHFYINTYKPVSKYKNIWNGLQLLIGVNDTYNNMSIGLRLKF